MEPCSELYAELGVPIINPGAALDSPNAVDTSDDGFDFDLVRRGEDGTGLCEY